MADKKRCGNCASYLSKWWANCPGQDSPFRVGRCFLLDRMVEQDDEPHCETEAKGHWVSNREHG